MTVWTPFSVWMAFQYLDESEGLASSFTIAYKITDDGAELWSSRFNRFKQKNRAALCGGAEVLKAAVPLLMRTLKLNMAQTVLVPALSSSECTAAATGVLPTIARQCAQIAGAHFALDAIKKKPHRAIHNIYSAADRAAVLDDAGYAASALKARTVLVLDDFITRGGTLSRIAQAIIAANPGATVYGIALAKTERRAWVPTISNDHVPKKWDTLWKKGEAR